MGIPLMWSGLGPAVPLWLSAALSAALAIGCISVLGLPGRSDGGRESPARFTRTRRRRHARSGARR